MYGIQLPDLPEEGEWKTIQRREYTLYLTGTNHTELPGFYVIAKSNDLSDPPWGWEEDRTSGFGK